MASVVYGQAAAPSQAAAPANGVNGAKNTGAATRGGGSKPQPPAPAANARVEVTGRPSANRSGTVDRPLLPIVSGGNGFGIRSGTPILVKLRAPLDSGHARNGDMVNATLAEPLNNLPAGTPVRLTVVQSVPAGQLFSYGELSIQVVSIADRRVLSDTITAQGKEGAKELPDAAPARGTEAIFTPGQAITLPAA